MISYQLLVMEKKKVFLFMVESQGPETNVKKKCYKLSFCSYFSEYLIRKTSSINVKLDFVEEKNIAWS